MRPLRRIGCISTCVNVSGRQCARKKLVPIVLGRVLPTIWQIDTGARTDGTPERKLAFTGTHDPKTIVTPTAAFEKNKMAMLTRNSEEDSISVRGFDSDGVRKSFEAGIVIVSRCLAV